MEGEDEDEERVDWTGFLEDFSPSSSERTVVGMRKEIGGGEEEEVE